MGVLRVSEAGELYGLDLHEHGISAYPDYVTSSTSRPSGMMVEDASKPSPAVGETKLSEATSWVEPIMNRVV